MSDTKKILIIGGGFSGMSAAIAMRQAGLQVDLIEIDPQWRSYGAGISLGGPTLRTFKQLGILEAFLEAGAAHDGVTMHLGNGHPIAELPTPRLAGPDVPGGGAIMRPVLAKLMAQATRLAGVNVKLGCTFSAIDAQSGTVMLSDGTQATYDLIVGADGVNSQVRETLFTDAPKPRYTGQSVWRCVLPKPAEVKSTMMWIGSRTKPGVNPTSKTDMYMFMTEHRPSNTFVDPSEFVSTMRGLLADFSAPLLQQLREQINEDSQIVFRPLEALLMPAPWYQSKVVLIGDAVHATTPHLASGACIGIEDGIVLAQSLAAHSELQTALQAFQDRRYERCRMVVENSLRLGELEATNGDKDEHGRIMGESLRALAAPI